MMQVAVGAVPESVAGAHDKEVRARPRERSDSIFAWQFPCKRRLVVPTPAVRRNRAQALMRTLQYAAHTPGQHGLTPLLDAVGDFGMLCRRTNKSQAAVVAALVSN